MAYRIGIDIGGTFTDFALFDDATGAIAIHKQLTTPRDPSAGVLDGVEQLLERRGVGAGEIEGAIHGSTLVTNGVIERRGAVTGMLVTAGFRDALDIAMERRYDLYDLRLTFPTPIVPRMRRFELDERIAYDGAVRTVLDLDQARKAIDELIRAHRIESLAICLLHSFTNPAHERAIAELAAREFPQLYVSASHEVAPFMREYQRWTTTTINAFSQPLVDRYLERLENGLHAMGFAGKFTIMTSSGGAVTPATARRFPVRMLESGPAAGVLMSSFLGRLLDRPDVLSFDMGGTTAKGAFVRDRIPVKKYELEVARVHEFKAGSGLPVRIPAIDMIEIGSGGGSIAEIDERGVIRVGPRSAGADPGPVCYGRGGAQPTLTDANLVLGYLDPEFFLGGEMRLDRDAAEGVVVAQIGTPLGLDTARAAWGIHEIASEDVARAFRVHASERGFDYRRSTMVAFGGCGPIHALRIARKLRIPHAILPLGAGVASAIGMLVRPIAFEVARSERVQLAELSAGRFEARFQNLIDEAAAFLVAAGIDREAIGIVRKIDMRYRGQGYEIELVVPEGLRGAAALAELPGLFARAYERVFSVSYLTEPLEIVNWKLEAAAPAPEMSGRYGFAEGTAVASAARKGSRRAYFPEGGYRECAVFDRYALAEGDAIEGPALVEEREATVVVGPGDRVMVDARGNLIAEIASA